MLSKQIVKKQYFKHIILIENFEKDIFTANFITSGDITNVIIPILLKSEPIYIIESLDFNDSTIENKTLILNNIKILTISQDGLDQYIKILKENLAAILNNSLSEKKSTELSFKNNSNIIKISEKNMKFNLSETDIIFHNRLCPPTTSHIYKTPSEKALTIANKFKNFILINDYNITKNFTEKLFCRNLLATISPKSYIIDIDENSKIFLNKLIKESLIYNNKVNNSFQKDFDKNLSIINNYIDKNFSNIYSIMKELFSKPLNFIYQNIILNKGLIIKPDDDFGGYGFSNLISCPNENKKYNNLIKIKELLNENKEKDSEYLISRIFIKSLIKSIIHSQLKNGQEYIHNKFIIQEKANLAKLGDIRISYFETTNGNIEIQNIFRRVPNNIVGENISANLSQGNSRIVSFSNIPFKDILAINAEANSSSANKEEAKNIFIQKLKDYNKQNIGDNIIIEDNDKIILKSLGYKDEELFSIFSGYLFYILNNVTNTLNHAYLKLKKQYNKKSTDYLGIIATGLDIIAHKDEQNNIIALVTENNIFNYMMSGQSMILASNNKLKYHEFSHGKLYIENCEKYASSILNKKYSIHDNNIYKEIFNIILQNK